MRTLVAALVLALCTPAVANAAAPACTDITTASGMHANLCDPGSDTALVLVPGATYNSAYWDFPYRPELYSFSKAMNAAGYATATVDRLGTGRSDKPLSVTVTAARQASAVNDVVQSLRDRGFRKVVLGGHSLGSMISIVSASTYRNVDAVLITAATHLMDAPTFLDFAATRMEPRSLLDPGYLTTKPGERYHVFHAPSQVEAAMVAADEATKDVASMVEITTGLTLGVALPYSIRINVPVLLAIGEVDPLLCSPIARDCSTAERIVEQERLAYAGSPDLRGYVMPGGSHDLNLHPDTRNYQRAVINWLNDVV